MKCSSSHKPFEFKKPTTRDPGSECCCPVLQAHCCQPVGSSSLASAAHWLGPSYCLCGLAALYHVLSAGGTLLRLIFVASCMCLCKIGSMVCSLTPPPTPHLCWLSFPFSHSVSHSHLFLSVSACLALSHSSHPLSVISLSAYLSVCPPSPYFSSCPTVYISLAAYHSSDGRCDFTGPKYRMLSFSCCFCRLLVKASICNKYYRAL